MSKMKNPWLWVGALMILALIPNSGMAKNKIPSIPAGAIPGSVSSSAGGYRILLEGGRILQWNPDSQISLQEGPKVSLVNLKATAKKQSGEEAMGLDVEETDLGGQFGSKTYLHHKKQPVGRALDPSAVGKGEDPKNQGQKTSKNVQGITVSTTKFPNGSYQLGIHWGKTQETVLFDRRNKMIWVKQAQKLKGLDYTLQQYADGSFSRRYKKSDGEIDYNYDSIGDSYRIIFKNPNGDIVAEADCVRTCALE